MIKLTEHAVADVMSYVLFKDDEITSGVTPENAVLVEGIVRNYGFHKERVMSKKAVIDDLLSQLPEAFDAKKEGGWSFLMACNDKFLTDILIRVNNVFGLTPRWAQ